MTGRHRIPVQPISPGLVEALVWVALAVICTGSAIVVPHLGWWFL